MNAGLTTTLRVKKIIRVIRAIGDIRGKKSDEILSVNEAKSYYDSLEKARS